MIKKIASIVPAFLLHAVSTLRKRHRIEMAVLFFLCALVYSNTLFNHFTADDSALLSNICSMRSLKFFPNLFTAPLFGTGCFYRPLTNLFLFVEYNLFHLHPAGYHLLNIVFHFFTCALLFKFLMALFNSVGKYKEGCSLLLGKQSALPFRAGAGKPVQDCKAFLIAENSSPAQQRKVMTKPVRAEEFSCNRTLSLVTSSLFAVHPIHHTIINQATQNVTLMSVIMMASMLCFVQSLIYPNKRLFFYSILLYSISIFVREEAVVLVPLYLLCILIFLPKRSAKQSIRLLLPFLVCGIAYFVFRLFFISMHATIFNKFTKTFPLFEYGVSFLCLMARYFSALLFSKNIVWMWNLPSRGPLLYVEALAVMVLFFAVVVLVVVRWKRSARSFGAVWFMAGAMPTILAIGVRPTFGLSMETHWFYTASLGIFLCAGTFLIGLKTRINGKLWICFVVSLFLLYGTKTMEYNRLWKDQKTYNRYWLSIYPNNLARFNLANIYLIEGDYDKAGELYREMLNHSFYKTGNTVSYDWWEASQCYAAFGVIYYNTQRFDEADAMFSRAIELNPNNAGAHYNRANIFLMNNDSNNAIIEYEHAVRSDPFNVDAYYNLALLYFRQGDEKKALQAYSNVNALDKDYMNRALQEIRPGP